jgi:hypothetical protein
VARANAPSQAVADPCQWVKTRKRNCRRVLTWFASRWRNHQPKRAEKPHSKSNVARCWTALLRGRRLRLSRRMASGSRQPPRGERPMSARERECGELPSPKFVPVQPQGWAGTFCFVPGPLSLAAARGPVALKPGPIQADRRVTRQNGFCGPEPVSKLGAAEVMRRSAWQRSVFRLLTSAAPLETASWGAHAKRVRHRGKDFAAYGLV